MNKYNERTQLMNKMGVSRYIYEHGYHPGYHSHHLGNLLMTLKRLGYL